MVGDENVEGTVVELSAPDATEDGVSTGVGVAATGEEELAFSLEETEDVHEGGDV